MSKLNKTDLLHAWTTQFISWSIIRASVHGMGGGDDKLKVASQAKSSQAGVHFISPGTGKGGKGVHTS